MGYLRFGIGRAISPTLHYQWLGAIDNAGTPLCRIDLRRVQTKPAHYSDFQIICRFKSRHLFYHHTDEGVRPDWFHQIKDSESNDCV